MTDIFISYSKHDKDLVFSICNYLEKNGLTCWIAPRNIPPGTEYAAEIIKGIENCKLFLLMYSDTANQSQHVLREVGRAVHRNAPIIAYRITKAKPTKSMEYFLETIQWLDAPYKDCSSPEALLQAIKNVLEHKDIPVSTAPVKAHLSPLNLLHKYSTYVAGVLLIAVLVLIITIFRLNKTNPALNTQANQLLAENDVSNQTSDPTDSPVLVESATPSVDPSTDPSADPTSTPTDQAEIVPSTPNTSSSNTESDPEPEAVVIPGDTTPSFGSNDSGSSDSSSSDPSSPTHPNPPAAPEVAKAHVKVGDYMMFGTYTPGSGCATDDNKIKWLVLSVDENAGTALCLTDNIIDFKCYDAAESGKYFYDKQGNFPEKDTKYTPAQRCELFGNSDWASSNIRSWLNSSQAQVTYSGQPPTKSATSEYANAYSTQAGFLYAFSSLEKSLICPRNNSTSGNVLDSSTKTTTDKVFLLSQAEVQKYLIDQNFVTYATPTHAALANDKSGFYKSSGYDCYPWCLRTPDSSSSTDVIIVTSGTCVEKDYYKQIACLSGLGIRPAMVIKFSGQSLSGDGSHGNPYALN